MTDSSDETVENETDWEHLMPVPLKVEVYVAAISNPKISALLLGVPLGLLSFLLVGAVSNEHVLPIEIRAAMAYVAGALVAYAIVSKPY